tara:strand:+ start:286 stop:492 length:207 start_codon:yes stop_codon:yes gene_type:complete
MDDDKVMAHMARKLMEQEDEIKLLSKRCELSEETTEAYKDVLDQIAIRLKHEGHYANMVGLVEPLIAF